MTASTDSKPQPSTSAQASAAPETKSHKPRTIILCFDGLGIEFGRRNTNIVRLFSILRKDCPESQVCYYQPGLRTHYQPGVFSPLVHSVTQTLDKQFAWYLYNHVIDGYTFLMQNYQEGDKICLFGFSRGAYTARALAGMLHKVGLLSKDNAEQIPFAYKIYKSHSVKFPTVDRYKQAFGREVKIDFLGVWDTVASVGYLYSPELPFVGSKDMIKVFRHALALDERRAMFRPNLYHHPSDPSRKRSKQKRALPKRVLNSLNPFGKSVLKRSPDTPNIVSATKKGSVIDTDVQEVWFAGCHSDVGGGIAKDNKLNALSNVSLRWMVGEVMKADCGVLFDDAMFEQWNIPPPETRSSITHSLPEKAAIPNDVPAPSKHVEYEERESPHHPVSGETDAANTTACINCGQVQVTPPAPSAQEKLEHRDVVKKGVDRLKKGKLWWIMEIFPTSYKWQEEDGQWVKQRGLHRGQGRRLPPNPLFHESVKKRMEAMEARHSKYSPKAKYKGTSPSTVKYVD